MSTHTTGRTANGSNNHCAQGRGTSTEVILDWKPFEYTTQEMQQTGKKVYTETVRFEALPDGKTRVVDILQANFPGPRLLRKILARFFFVTIYKVDKLLLKAASLAGDEALRTSKLDMKNGQSIHNQQRLPIPIVIIMREHIHVVER